MAHRPSTTNMMHVDYSGPSGAHTFQIRFADSTTLADALAETNTFIALLQPLMYSATSFTGLRWQVKGSFITTPLAFTAVNGTGGASGGIDTYPDFMSFVGRGVNGKRVRISLFDTTQHPDGNYRKQGAEITTAMQNVITRLQTGGNTFAYLSADADITRWKPYINLGRNAYYQRKARRIRA